MTPKTRIDQLLVARGVCASREKAQRAIMAGRVTVAGRTAEKPGLQVPQDAIVEMRSGEKYVGRGAFKLEAALDQFSICPRGKICLDIGASTGGFTDSLLQRGALRVHAIDVGRGQLHWKLRNDPRVVVREGVNARYLGTTDLGEQAQICVIDVSFISLTLILPRAFALLTEAADMVVLIKPQFELSPAKVGRGGIVRNPAFRSEAIEKIRSFIEERGKSWLGVIESPLPGREGNIEFLAHFRT
jgi:23S rRNA (cytidine1920-2'-O)/16S rRNA (cytidine1409-2'-O)-methyltransferase